MRSIVPLLQPAGVALPKPRAGIDPLAVAEAEEELHRIFRIEYTSAEQPSEAAARFKGAASLQYAEPYLLFTPLGGEKTPNDSLFASQAFLKLIKAEEAWDVVTGDSTVVIAVADTDIKWDHPDLEPSIWINPGENGKDGQGRDKRSNGVDDDSNGKVDDWHGWDFGGADGNTPDNDTRSTGAGAGHGTAVAGLVAAATNNRIGISSISNGCKILPLKIGADAGGNLAFGYDALNFAANMGARVFNASWGSFGYSQALQDVVNACVAKGMIICGGAGNHGGTAAFYPGSFNGVLDVGVCDANDNINAASGYGPTVDVFTPGDGALTTNTGNAYSGFGMTSAASPIASGLAGLVASKFPSWTPEQIRERIRVTCDNIDAKNPTRVKIAGKGRVNAFRAVSDPPTPSLRVNAVTFADPNSDKRLDVGEEIGVVVTLKNALAATSGSVTLTLVPIGNASSVQVTKASVTIPAIAEGAYGNNSTEPMTFTILPGAAFDASVQFRLDISAGTYEDFDFFATAINPSFRDMTSGTLTLTIGANGMFGFMDYPTNSMGGGMRNGTTDAQLYLSSVMIGTDVGHIVDNARSVDNFLTRRNDFRITQAVTVRTPAGGGQPAKLGASRFTDANADSARRLNVEVAHDVFDYSNRGVNDVLISKFTVTNKGAAALQGVRFGLYVDVGGYPQYYNASPIYDSTRHYCSVTKGGSIPVVGTFVLDTLPSSDPRRSTFWAINNDPSLPGNPFGTYDGFSMAERWRALSTYAGNRTAPAGNLGYVITAPVADIAPGASATFVFGTLAGSSQPVMRTRVDAALNLLRNPPVLAVDDGTAFPRHLALRESYPHPVSASQDGSVRLGMELPVGAAVTAELFDALGRSVRRIAAGQRDAGFTTMMLDVSGLAPGAYVCRVTAGADVASRTLLVQE
jgi:hypothetical protein